MSNQYEFQCPFCGKDFGSEVIDMAKHIGKLHDPSRSWFANGVDSIICIGGICQCQKNSKLEHGLE